MTGFVATAPVPCNAPADAISNDGWFPDISMAATRNAMRLDGTITDPRLRAALIAALLDINRQLRNFKTAQQASGHTRLSSIDSSHTIDGQTQLEHLYQRAVMCTAKADLIERYRDFDANGSNTRLQDNAPAIDEQRRNAQWAVRDILGETHTVVELI